LEGEKEDAVNQSFHQGNNAEAKVNSLVAVLLGRMKEKQESTKEEKASSMGKHTNAGERATTIIAGSRQGTSGTCLAVSSRMLCTTWAE